MTTSNNIPNRVTLNRIRALRTRLNLAQHAELKWPSTRRRVELDRIENELVRLTRGMNGDKLLDA